MEQSSILSAKFDCPVACQDVSLFATAHDCETGLCGDTLIPRGFLAHERTWGEEAQHKRASRCTRYSRSFEHANPTRSHS